MPDFRLWFRSVFVWGYLGPKIGGPRVGFDPSGPFEWGYLGFDRRVTNFYLTG